MPTCVYSIEHTGDGFGWRHYHDQLLLMSVVCYFYLWWASNVTLCCGKINQRFMPAEYNDINFIYGFYNGNSKAAVEECQRHFPHHWIPNRQLFSDTHQRLREMETNVPHNKDVAWWPIAVEKHVLDLVSEGFLTELVNLHCRYGKPHKMKGCITTICNVCKLLTGWLWYSCLLD